jgi:hypothetical protein
MVIIIMPCKGTEKMSYGDAVWDRKREDSMYGVRYVCRVLKKKKYLYGFNYLIL